MGAGGRFVISVLVTDRVGILRGITAAIADLRGNIDAISQTVVEGYFTVILTATFPEIADPAVVRDAIARRFGRDEVSVIVRPFEPAAAPRRAGPADRYVLTLWGREQPGILKAVTAYLAEKGINIEDLYFKITGERVVHIGELSIPRRLDLKQVQDELQRALAPMGLTACLQHENIFRATNEVMPIRDLLREAHDA